ncbi:peptidase C54, partial [Martensiomyces pterosporus]
FFLDGMRRFYFTYRKGFPTITPSFYTSDMGWGCTYRTCQMMLAEAFARVSLGRFWDPFRLNATQNSRHGRIIEWFHDTDAPNSHYSIHRMARTATEMDKRIGDWLGPSIAAHVMKRLSSRHSGCPLTIHVALDQTVYASEVRKQALARDDDCIGTPSWNPLLLLVPVRLGLERLNLGYIPKIKTLFQIPQSVGLVGGKPSRSFYFVGRQGDSLFYLDPHVTRQHVPRSTSLDGQSRGLFGIPDTDEYHTSHICSMPIYRLDPSMLLGFLFNTEAEWDTFVMAATDKESQRSICTGSTPLFTLMSGSSMMVP